MGAFSDYLETALINATLRNVSYTSASPVYVGLHTTSTGEDDSGTEVSGGSYARVAITFSAPIGGSTSNSSDVTFPTATASWGTVGWFGIYDDDTGGNLLYWGSLTVSKTVDSGDVFKFSSGNLVVTLD